VQGLDWARYGGSSSHCLTLRNWRPGDQYQPQGHAAAEKIKTLFQENRVPLWERRSWPVIVDGNNTIMWSRKFGAATQFAARPDSRKVLTIRETAESNPAAAASNY
jgi:tRNA(Ile)-lysidine synthase